MYITCQIGLKLEIDQTRKIGPTRLNEFDRFRVLTRKS